MNAQHLSHLFFLFSFTVIGCGTNQPVVVVYTALDREFSQPILERFTQKTGIQVLAKYDVESTKTVGLARQILVERNHPRCDVFWNNEIIHTLRLQQEGVLSPCFSKSGMSYPESFRSKDSTWYGFAARARVLLVNHDRVARKEWPRHLWDLTDNKWKGQIGIAKPLFGTTATQAVCLFAQLGEQEAKRFYLELRNNQVQILSGNKQVAQSVGTGELSLGLTDTDDALVTLREGYPVTIIYPDSSPTQPGTLFIPNTVARIRSCPHPKSAQQLIDYLLSPEVETALAQGASGQIPLNPSVNVSPSVETPSNIAAMTVDFEQAALLWNPVQTFLKQEFTAPIPD